MEKGHISSTKFQYPKILEKKKNFNAGKFKNLNLPKNL